MYVPRLLEETDVAVLHELISRHPLGMWVTQAHGRVVPTWNYAVVHASGMPRAIHDRDWLLRLVNRLTDAQETHRTEPWKVSDAPAGHGDRLLERIVGIEIPIERILGKWKTRYSSILENDQAPNTRNTAATHASTPRSQGMPK